MSQSHHRDEHLSTALNRTLPWDLIIIGGGASGVGAALDAAVRGLSVVLLEASDFGKGTSSRSTKLIHGGVRYLRQGNFSLVRESLRERSRLLRNAPHLVHPLDFILPCRNLVETAFYRMGMKLYDLLGQGGEFPGSSCLSKGQVLNKLPALSPMHLNAGISYSDGQFDDSRLLINMVQTAAEKGAILINGARVRELTKSQGTRLNGLLFRDEETGLMHQLRARCIINATGPFCDAIRKLDRSDAKPLVAASQGIHLVLPKVFFPGDSALIVPRTRDGRVMFIIPWHDHVLLGTTDTPIPNATEEPRAIDHEVDFLLDTAGEYLRISPSRSDCLSMFAGIRPLVMLDQGKSTATLSRDHAIEISPSGLLTITGGKWTTYRQMAEDCIDHAIESFGFTVRPSATHELRLHGCPLESTVTTDARFQLYGTDGPLIEQLIREKPELGERLHSDLPICIAEVVWAVRHEWARTIEDVLARRNRALFLNARAAIAMAPTVARWMAEELNRDPEWQSAQILAFEQIARNFIP
ncbi:MAG TPA: glycerol-3-phosphate dehydrogenase/oxidase [Pirellula sp.]|nr:glycerol-3-phosphate dehydrogenase/oxidase [Pirellula sp.]